MNSLILFTIFSLILPWFGRADPPVQYSITGFGPEVLESENLMTQVFQEWMEKHGITYLHAEETSKRFEIFKQNLKYIIESNSKQTGFAVGLNRFADISNAEFKEKYIGKNKQPVYLNQVVNVTRSDKVVSCDAPSALDWREKGVITPVKDQGDCGACWAFSATGSIEAINAINNGELISLSEQELLDCDTIDQGCDGGIMQQAFEWITNNGGIDTEDDYPYTGVQRSCDRNKVEKKIVKIDGYKDLDRSESSLLCAVSNQPVTVALQGSSFDFQLYTSGIYDGACSSNPKDIDHAVLIVGYGSENGKDYWIAKNSWGPYWGMKGYIYIRRNTDKPYGVCALNAQASYPIQTPSAPSPYSPFPAPQPPPPPHKPPPPPSPTPPSPSPSICGDLTYCPADQTCCCIFEFFDYCITYGCCKYSNAVCCKDSNYCCPRNYPICDTLLGLCLKDYGDKLGVAAMEKKLAKYKLPWSNKFEESEEMTYQPLQWKRNRFTAIR